MHRRLLINSFFVSLSILAIAFSPAAIGRPPWEEPPEEVLESTREEIEEEQIRQSRALFEKIARESVEDILQEGN